MAEDRKANEIGTKSVPTGQQFLWNDIKSDLNSISGWQLVNWSGDGKEPM